MISRNEFNAYNLAVEQIGNKAASDVESSVLNWCRQNPDASVAEKREAAKLIMEGYDIASRSPVLSYEKVDTSLIAPRKRDYTKAH